MQKLFIVLIVLGSMTAGAQVMKGSVFVSGTLSAQVTNYQNYRQNTFSFNPEVGFLISARSAFGVGVNWNYSKYTNESSTQNVSADVFHRWYVPIVPKFYFVLHSQISYGNLKIPGSEESSSGTEHQTMLSVTPKFIYFPCAKVSLAANLGNISFTHLQDDYTVGASSHTNNVGLSFPGVSLGIAYYFRTAQQ